MKGWREGERESERESESERAKERERVRYQDEAPCIKFMAFMAVGARC